MGANKTIRWGVTGLGGYAAEVCKRLLAEASPAKHSLTVVYEPHPDRFSQWVTQLLEKGVVIVGSYEELLAQEIDAVWLPLPIDLHRSFTEQAVNSGKAVMCEKPAAGCVQDVDAMIAARDASKQIVAIGFQDVYQPVVYELKRRLLRGEFGVILSASVMACWPRGQSYFGRNDWAGKLKRGESWILDSPANNAMAHYLHLAQFLLGSTETESAIPSEVEAELYRANPIENYDTCSLRLTFDGGVHLLANFTHACNETVEPELIIRTQWANIRYRPGIRLEIHNANVSELKSLNQDRLGPALDAMSNWIRIGPEAARGATLEMARAHTLTINAASEASTIVQIPADQIDTLSDPAGSTLLAVRGIEAGLRASILHDRMPHEIGSLPWTRPAGDFQLRDYSEFRGPKL